MFHYRQDSNPDSPLRKTFSSTSTPTSTSPSLGWRKKTVEWLKGLLRTWKGELSMTVAGALRPNGLSFRLSLETSPCPTMKSAWGHHLQTHDMSTGVDEDGRMWTRIWKVVPPGIDIVIVEGDEEMVVFEIAPGRTLIDYCVWMDDEEDDDL